MAKTCEQCLIKQSKLFSIDTRKDKSCVRCKSNYSTREYETFCDECSEIYGICRGCGSEI